MVEVWTETIKSSKVPTQQKTKPVEVTIMTQLRESRVGGKGGEGTAGEGEVGSIGRERNS